MNMAKWVLWAVLAMPFLELAVFVAVAATIGFSWALSLIIAGSLAGLLILRRAGGSHVSRIRVALSRGTFTTLQADAFGGLTLLAGILLLIPGFISDAVALMLLFRPFRLFVGNLFGIAVSGRRDNGVVDLAPEQWRRVPDASFPGKNDGARKERKE